MEFKTIIDVRSPEEFAGGHVVGSINIPLDELPGRLPELCDLPQPILLCCRSGARSGVATNYLQQVGIECSNGGSWFDVNAFVNGSIKS